ncbi:glycoside hydrolase domain-containing protein [Niabella aquatica]
MKQRVLAISMLLASVGAIAQKNTNKQPADYVNVFLGTSGDHGQLSPAAGYPFNYMSIVPQTYPKTHTGYEYYAKQFLGFAHTVFEGVGCRGSGGNILVKPFINSKEDLLEKVSQHGSPGSYFVTFANKISAAFVAGNKYGQHLYTFPRGQHGLVIDLAYSLSNGFKNTSYSIAGNAVQGWIEAGTTCGAGAYKIYFYLVINKPVTWQQTATNEITATWKNTSADTARLCIGLSSVNETYARKAIKQTGFTRQQEETKAAWNKALQQIQVSGTAPQKKELFYSLLYRTIQSPYNISEPDGVYRANDGSLQKSKTAYYNGWSIWDNYKTQLPLLSVAYPEQFAPVAQSIAQLYLYGKKDYATQTEPSNTVRTEHAVVALLDAYRKGVPVDLKKIYTPLKNEIDGLDFSKPDKALESSYDTWAFAEIASITGNTADAAAYKQKALQYKTYWNKDFKDLTKKDVDQMQARGLYQGTIWQYRWFVPFDVAGLIQLTGGESAFIEQLKTFFNKDLYNHANEPDIQAPSMFNATSAYPFSQYWMHTIAADTIVQYYFNDNSKGIDPYVGPVYKNEPKALLRTMDDDGGAMSAWYVFAAIGLYPAAVGEPVYYLHVPQFKIIELKLPQNRKFRIEVKNFNPRNKYIKNVWLNDSPYLKNYILHADIMKGGHLAIETTGKISEAHPGLKIWSSSYQ